MKQVLVDSGLTALSPLTLHNHSILHRHLAGVSALLSSYSVPALLIWQDLFKYYWAVVEDYLCLYARYQGNYYMPLPPLGSGVHQGVVAECFSLMNRLNTNPAVARIENVAEESVGLFEAMGLKIRPSDREYLYRRDALARLQGDPYKSKRWAVNHFIRHYNPVFEPYRSGDLLECLELFEVWKNMRLMRTQDQYYKALLEDSAFAHCRAMEYHEALNLVGRVVRIDGRIRAYTFGFQLRPQIFCILLEVTDLRVKGLAQYIYARFCQELEGYQYINAMDDSGLESIRRAKESYHPEQVLSSYAVYEK